MVSGKKRGDTQHPPPHLGHLRRQTPSFWEEQRGLPATHVGQGSCESCVSPGEPWAGARVSAPQRGRARMTPAALPTRQSAPRSPGGGLHWPAPAPPEETPLRCQALPAAARCCSSSPGSWLGPKGESTACPAHPGPTSLPSPWDPEHRADLPGHHPSSNVVSGSPHSGTRHRESTAPPGSSLPCPLGGHKLQVLTWMPFVWLGAPRDGFKMFSPSLPRATCMQQVFHPPPSPGEMNLSSPHRRAGAAAAPAAGTCMTLTCVS